MTDRDGLPGHGERDEEAREASHAMPQTKRAQFRSGIRAGSPFAIALILLALSFAVVAKEAGLSGTAAVLMSAIVFASASQFTAVAILAAGGTAGAAVVGAALMNSRFLPMGVAFAPSLSGGPFRRAAEAQAIIDSSWALAARGDGTFDRWLLFGASAIQWLGWTLGTVAGVLVGGALGDPSRLGLDAVYPAFFVSLLVRDARSAEARTVAVLGAAIALALVAVAPPGLPILAASLAALVGLRRRVRMSGLRVR